MNKEIAIQEFPITCRLCGKQVFNGTMKEMDEMIGNIQTHLVNRHKDVMPTFLKDLQSCGQDNIKLLQTIDNYVDLKKIIEEAQKIQELASKLPSRDIDTYPDQCEDINPEHKHDEISDDKKELIKDGISQIEEEMGVKLTDVLKMFTEFADMMNKNEELQTERFNEICKRLERLEKITYAWATKEKLILLKDNEILDLIVSWKRDSGL
jgi:hypothetical protein